MVVTYVRVLSNIQSSLFEIIFTKKGLPAVLEIFENGKSIEKIKLSTLTDRKEMHSLLESRGFPLKGSAGSGGGGSAADAGEEEDNTAVDETQAIRRVRRESSSTKKKRSSLTDSEMRRTTRKLILVVLATFIGLGCLVLRSSKYIRGVHKRADVATSNGKSSVGGSSNTNKSSSSGGAATRRMVTATA